jgi:hypothetical protein
MLFNTDISYDMHIGHNNQEHAYVPGTNTLEKVDEQRDLGVIIQKSLKHDKKADNSANQVLGMIKSQ